MKLLKQKKAESKEKNINLYNRDSRNFLRASTVIAAGNAILVVEVAGSLSPAELNTVGAFGNTSWLSPR